MSNIQAQLLEVSKGLPFPDTTIFYPLPKLLSRRVKIAHKQQKFKVDGWYFYAYKEYDSLGKEQYLRVNIGSHVFDLIW